MYIGVKEGGGEEIKGREGEEGGRWWRNSAIASTENRRIAVILPEDKNIAVLLTENRRITCSSINRK